jgi:hypothetical protein
MIARVRGMGGLAIIFQISGIYVDDYTMYEGMRRFYRRLSFPKGR